MKLYNLKDHNEQVSFAQAVTQGLGKHQGLFFPHDLPEFSLTEIDDMLAQDFVTRSAKILSAFIGDEIPQDVLQQRHRQPFGHHIEHRNPDIRALPGDRARDQGFENGGGGRPSGSCDHRNSFRGGPAGRSP